VKGTDIRFHSLFIIAGVHGFGGVLTLQKSAGRGRRVEIVW